MLLTLRKPDKIAHLLILCFLGTIWVYWADGDSRNIVPVKGVG